MKKLFLLAALLLFCADTGAEEIMLDVSLHAHHWDRTAVAERNLNETNPGLGVEIGDADVRKMTGIYWNSDRKITAYALAAWTPLKAGPAELGVVGGLATGYYKPVVPVAGVFSAITITRDIKLNLIVTPTIERLNCYGFIAFQLAFKL